MILQRDAFYLRRTGRTLPCETSRHRNHIRRASMDHCILNSEFPGSNKLINAGARLKCEERSMAGVPHCLHFMQRLLSDRLAIHG